MTIINSNPIEIDRPVLDADPAFELSDFVDAVNHYVDEDVTVTITEIDPAVTSSIEPGELGTFTVTVQNGPIALEDVWLHLTFEDPTRADFQVPPGAGLIVQDDINGNNLPRNTFVDAMFIQQVIGGELDADEAEDFELTLKGSRVGQTDVRCHVHAKVPVSELLKRVSGPNSITSLVVE